MTMVAPPPYLAEEDLVFGTMQCKARRVLPSTSPRSIQRVGTGSDLERSQRPGVSVLAYTDLSGGLRTQAGILSASRDITQLYSNDGMQCRLPGLAILPDAPTVQASITDQADISGFVALNKNRHDLVWAGGDTIQRWMSGFGTKIYGSNSSTGALFVRNTLTDNIISSGILRVNGVDYASWSCRGTTDGVKGASDVSGNGALTLTQLVAFTDAADGFWAMQYIAQYDVNVAVGAVGGVAGWWWWKGTGVAAPVTPKALVFADTKDVEGSAATTTTAATSPASTYEVAASGDQVSGADANWDDAANAASSNDVYAVFTQSGTGEVRTNRLGFDFSGVFTSIPLANIITGIQFEVECKEGNAANNAYLIAVRIVVNGSQVGIAPGYGTELGTSDAYISVGGSTSRFGIGELKGEDVRGLAVEIQFRMSNEANTISVDHGRLTLTHRPPGAQQPMGAAGATGGGSGCVPSLTNPARVAYRYPVTANPTAITQPYRLLYNDITWDAEGDRPVGTFTFPSTGQGLSVHAMTPFQGGYAAILGTATGPGIIIKLIGADGLARNLNVPAFMGTTAWRFNSIVAQGEWLVIDAVASDYSDRQFWLWNAGKTHADFLKQSLSGTSIALQPLPACEFYLDVGQNNVISVFPRTTNTAATRVHIQPDLFADPRLVNTSWTKTMATVSVAEDTKVYAIGVEVDHGPPEANKVVSQLTYQGRSISSSSTVQFGFNITGSGSVASPDGSATFTSAFTSSSPALGVAYRSFQPWWGLAHTASSANTPNGLNIVVYGAMQWVELRRLVFLVDPSKLAGSGDLWDWENDFVTMVNTRLTQRLYYSNIGGANNGVLAYLDSWDFEKAIHMVPNMTPTEGESLRDGRGRDTDAIMYRLTFQEVPGAVA